MLKETINELIKKVESGDEVKLINVHCIVGHLDDLVNGNESINDVAGRILEDLIDGAENA